jgi:hypothetical protein
MTTIEGPNGLFKIERIEGLWDVSIWSTCAIGPHWHYLATYGRKRDALDLAAADATHTPGSVLGCTH